MSRLTLNSGTQHQYTPDGSDLVGTVSLDNLSDVTITLPLNNQILVYNSSAARWENEENTVALVDGGTY